MDSSAMAKESNTTPGKTLTRLREAKWYAFDLDDTLHNFTNASAAAVRAVLEVIHEKSDRTLEELEAYYKHILNKETASAFIDGKTSHQYREDRFQRLVRACDIVLYEGQMKTLIKLYDKVLKENLELKPGVIDLFKTLKRYSHKIAVITEGPQDAQERTVKALHLAPFIDYLATTNKLKVAKVDGLFTQVLGHLNLDPKDMIMTGDSWERDIVPATQAGLYCFHYSLDVLVTAESDLMGFIRRFDQLRALIETAHREGRP